MLTNDPISSLQFGFYKGLGTFDALLTIASAVQTSLDTGCEWCGELVEVWFIYQYLNGSVYHRKIRTAWKILQLLLQEYNPLNYTADSQYWGGLVPTDNMKFGIYNELQSLDSSLCI